MNLLSLSFMSHAVYRSVQKSTTVTQQCHEAIKNTDEKFCKGEGGGTERQMLWGKQYYYTNLKTANWKTQVKIILVPTSCQQSIFSSESRWAYASPVGLRGLCRSSDEDSRNKVFPHLRLPPATPRCQSCRRLPGGTSRPRKCD